MRFVLKRLAYFCTLTNCSLTDQLLNESFGKECPAAFWHDLHWLTIPTKAFCIKMAGIFLHSLSHCSLTDQLLNESFGKECPAAFWYHLGQLTIPTNAFCIKTAGIFLHFLSLFSIVHSMGFCRVFFQ